MHQIIERVPHTNRYQVTSFGLEVAMFFTRTCNRLLRTGLSQICDPAPIDTSLRHHFDRLEGAITDMIGKLGLAA